MAEDLQAAVASMEKKLNFLMEMMYSIDKKCMILRETVLLHKNMIKHCFDEIKENNKKNEGDREMLLNFIQENMNDIKEAREWLSELSERVKTIEKQLG